MTLPSDHDRYAILNTDTEMPIWAARLQLPLLSAPDAAYPFLLLKEKERLTLRWQAHAPPIDLSIDFVHGRLAYRGQQALRKEPLIKAAGLKLNHPLKIIDATAGLGRDSFIFASAGAEVLMIEQHPLIAALLTDALKRLQATQHLALSLIEGKAENILQAQTYDADIIYLDPMFPPRQKSALVKKDMQILQALMRDQRHDDLALLDLALDLATKRVIVKRPRYAPPLSPHIAFQILTPYHRFDVYQPRGHATDK
jgi:16S rRNA (guanine1516-N2)-methyltransferase